MALPLRAGVGEDVSFGSFDSRRRWVLDAVAADPMSHGSLFWAAQVLFLSGQTDRGLSVWREAVRRQSAAKVRGVELFNYWPAIHCIARWQDILDTGGKEEIRRLLTTFPEYSTMRTSNLVTLAMVTRHLAGQVFGERDFIQAARYRPDDPDAGKALRRHIGKCAREGFGEWASWPYYDKNILPILSVAELAADPELRNMAGMAFEAGLAQNAAFWLDGRWAMPTARSYPDMLSSKPWGGPQTLWLYFGGIAPEVGGNLVGAAIMSYRPPQWVGDTSGGRSKAFTARSHFGKNFQSAFIDRNYGLFSEDQTDVVNWWQCYPYGVMWNDPDPARHSFLWLTAPMSDAPQTVSPSHPHGILSRVQSNLQHESALLYVFRFEDKTEFPYALCFVPGGHLAFVDDASVDGRVFLHYRGVLVAISATAPFEWHRDAGIRAPSGKPFPGDSEFRVEASPLAMSIECAHPDDFPAATPQEKLAAFREAIIKESKLKIQGSTGTHTDRHGNVLERTFQGGATINGVTVDHAAAPLLNNPWMKQPVGGALTVSVAGNTRLYDFESWSITES